MITDKASTTNKPPTIANTISCFVTTAIDPNAPPNERAPVSPMKTAAGGALYQRKPKPPPPPDEPPPDMPKPEFESADVSTGVDMSAVDANLNLNVDGGGYSTDGEYLPIVKVNPQYPRRAQTRGIEGYVIVEYWVTKTGAVRDPVVIDAKPPGIFNRAAINAALKYKYKPKVINGEPVDVPGVKTRITFEMADG